MDYYIEIIINQQLSWSSGYYKFYKNGVQYWFNNKEYYSYEEVIKKNSKIIS